MAINDYAHVDKVICAIARKLSKLPCMPKNLNEEKEKFFQSNSYNPIFVYEGQPAKELDALKNALLNLDISAAGIGMLFKKKQDELLKIIEMMKSIGTRRFTEISQSLYGIPDDKLLQKANDFIGIFDSPDESYISSEQVKVRLELALKKYGFTWQVREKDMISRAAVSQSSKLLFIKKDSFFTNKFIKRIIVHEIGTHILRAENGAQQPYDIFSLGLTGYLSTEEGLAVVNEEEHDCLTRSTLKTYAARVIAVHKAMRCTFRETYNYLLPHVGKENAFDITLRAKRGVGNTFFPGAFTKDYLYLKGYFDVRKFLDSGGDPAKLYYGKIGIDDIPFIEKISGLIHPMFLPQMRYYMDCVKY